MVLCRSKAGMEKLDAYLSNKHDQLLAKLFQPNSYKKKSSLAIVDGFSVEITEEQVTSCAVVVLSYFYFTAN